MQLVEIKYDKTELYPKIYIKNEEISDFMTLKGIVNNDIFVWADKFFAAADAEIGEPYKVVVTGHPFHEIVLDACMSKSKYCEEIKLIEHKRVLPLVEKYNFAVQKNSLYSPDKQTPSSLEVKCDSADYFDGLGIKNVTLTANDSPYHLLKEEEAWDCSPSKYRIVLASDNLVRKQRTKFNLFVTKDNLSYALDYFYCYHLILPFVKEFFESMKKKSLTDEAKLELEAYEREEYRIFAPNIPDEMDADKQYAIDCKFFPASLKPPHVTLKSSDESVAKCDGFVVRPSGAGKFILSLVDAAGGLYLSKEIAIIQHNYVKNIEIQVPAFTLLPDEILDFQCSFAPTDAEDLCRVQYTVSNPSVAVITADKRLLAVSPGRVQVTVATEIVKKSFFVSVLPPLVDIVLSSEKITMPYNSEAKVNCALMPHNASPVPNFTWSSSNPKIAKVIPTDNHGCKIVGRRFGECLVTCSVNGTNIAKQIKVTIKNGLSRR